MCSTGRKSSLVSEKQLSSLGRISVREQFGLPSSCNLKRKLQVLVFVLTGQLVNIDTFMRRISHAHEPHLRKTLPIPMGLRHYSLSIIYIHSMPPGSPHLTLDKSFPPILSPKASQLESHTTESLSSNTFKSCFQVGEQRTQLNLVPI